MRSRKRQGARVALDLPGLVGANDVFRLRRGSRRDPAVEAWLNECPLELRSVARQWFARMRACGEDVLELIHDGCPVACVDDAAFGYVNAFRRHVNVGFFNGAALEDPSGILEGTGRRMRHVTLRPDEASDAAALGRLIDAAYADVRVRLGKADPKAVRRGR